MSGGTGRPSRSSALRRKVGQTTLHVLFHFLNEPVKQFFLAVRQRKPPVGIVLFCILRKKMPISARTALTGSGVGFVFYACYLVV